jgi:hypothetical protein
MSGLCIFLFALTHPPTSLSQPFPQHCETLEFRIYFSHMCAAEGAQGHQQVQKSPRSSHRSSGLQVLPYTYFPIFFWPILALKVCENVHMHDIVCKTKVM